MDISTLRILAGLSQREAARLAGCSIRTWRRREHTGHTLTERWLRFECGQIPGWPRGWRARPGGVQLEGGRVIPFSVIEAAPWVLSLLEAGDRRAAYRRISRTALELEPCTLPEKQTGPAVLHTHKPAGD